MISDGNSSLRCGDFVRVGDERTSPTSYAYGKWASSSRHAVIPTSYPQQQTPCTVSQSTIGTTFVTQQTRGKNTHSHSHFTHITYQSKTSSKKSSKLAPLVHVESTSVFHSSNLAILFYCLFLLITSLLLPYINSIFHNYSLIHSDEGLTLETSVFESFTVANLPYRPCGW